MRKRTGLGRAYIVRPEPGLVFCSADQVAAEAEAFGVLQDSKRFLPSVPGYLEPAALCTNPNVQVPEGMKIREHPYIRLGLKIGPGEMPQDLVTEQVPAGIRKRLSGLLQPN